MQINKEINTTWDDVKKSNCYWDRWRREKKREKKRKKKKERKNI